MDRTPEQERPQRRHGGIVGRVLNHNNIRTGIVAGGVVVAALAVSDMIPGCESGPIEESTQLGDLGGVLNNVVVPRAQIGIIEGDGTGTGEVIDASYLHVPKIPLLGSLVNDINGVMEKLYSTSATAKVKASVEVVLAGGAMSLKPYELSGSRTGAYGIQGEGVEADVRVDGLGSELVTARPSTPDETSGEGFGTRVSDILMGNGDTTKTDNAATYVAQAYFQNVCGRALLGAPTYEGVQKYVQNIFRLDADYFKNLPAVSSQLDQEMRALSTQPVRVVFIHDGRPIAPDQIKSYVQDFGPPLPDSKNVAKLVDNSPRNVIVPRQLNGCTSTSYAIAQQEKLIQQAAASSTNNAG